MTEHEDVASIQEVLKALFIRESTPDISALPAWTRSLAEVAWTLLTDRTKAELCVPTSAIETLPDEIREVAVLRWKALLEWHKGKFSNASDYLDQAIDHSEGTAPMGWSRNDLEEDLLHCVMARANSGEREARSELRQSLHIERERSINEPYFRSLASAFRRTLESQIEDVQRSPHTVVFGGNLEATLDRLGESLEAALSLASIALVSSARTGLGHILYHYGRSYEAPDLVVAALVLYLLERNTKRVEGILKTDWQLLFSTLSRSPLRFMDNMCPRRNPLDVAARCSVLGVLGAYTPNERVRDLQDFILRAFDLDSEKDFHAVAMRKVLEVLPEFVTLLDPDEVLERLRPLLSGHPVVISHALPVLAQLNWEGVKEQRARETACELLELRGKALPGPGPFSALLEIRRTWPEATKPFEDDLLREWREEKKEGAIVYFAEVPDVLSQDIRQSFAMHLLELLRSENTQTQGAPLRFGGYSKWYLLSGYLVAESATLLDRALEVAVKVVLNPGQDGRVKRECMDVVLWVYDKCSEQREQIALEFVTPVLAASELATSCKSDDFLLRYSKERLQLRLDELAVLQGPSNYEEIVRDCVQLGMHPFVDTRGDTIRVLERLVDADPDASKQELSCLLLSRTYDDWAWNTGRAVSALSKWVAKNSAWEHVFASRLTDLQEHASIHVRHSVLHAAAQLSKEAREPKLFEVLVRRGTSDPHFKVRLQARHLLEETESGHSSTASHPDGES